MKLAQKSPLKHGKYVMRFPHISSICCDRTGITGFCSVKLDAAHGPRS